MMEQKEHKIQIVVLSLLDIAGIMISFLSANYIRNRRFWYENIDIELSTAILYMILLYLLLAFLKNSKQDFFKRGPWEELVEVTAKVTQYTALLIASMFCFKIASEISRIAFFLFYFFAITLVFVFRSIYKGFLLHVAKKSINTKRLVILTMAENVEEIKKRLGMDEMWNYLLKGLILLDVPDTAVGTECCGIPILGNYNNMYDCVTQRVVDEIFIHIPYSEGIHVAKAIEQYEAIGIAVNLNLQIYDVNLKCKSKELRAFGDYYVITFKESVSSLKMRAVKRMMDIIGAIVGLIVTGIVTVFLAPVLLVESPGPLIFSQVRVGLNGRKFKMYKFRSMYKDAEERKKELMAQNEMKGLMFKLENDPRITKVGKFIRKTSIDELPQFWNVLKGDMSLIGTRPPTLDEFEQYETFYKRRLSIRPGITGMWQATGRSDITDFEEVLALDQEYIDNWSLGLDMKILLKTVFGVFGGKGAK